MLTRQTGSALPKARNLGWVKAGAEFRLNRGLPYPMQRLTKPPSLSPLPDRSAAPTPKAAEHTPADLSGHSQCPHQRR